MDLLEEGLKRSMDKLTEKERDKVRVERPRDGDQIQINDLV